MTTIDELMQEEKTKMEVIQPNHDNHNGNGNGKKKKAVQQMPIAVEMGRQIISGNGNEVTNRLLTQINNTMRGNFAEEKTKFSVAEGLHDDNKIHHFTEYRDFNEVLRMNKIEMWTRIAPYVYGDTAVTRALIKDIFEYHITNHRKNMRSYQRKGEKAVVDILKSDHGEVPEASGWKKFTGMGK